MTNSTVSGNSAVYYGGGIANWSGTLTVTNSTICENSAAWDGGGVFQYYGSATLQNTIVAKNLGYGGAPDDVWGSFATASSHNLIGVIDGSTGLDGDPDTMYGNADEPRDPNLGPLQDNGGPTFTHALLPGSPATDAGDNDFATPTDQRGFGRVKDGNGDGLAVVDIGAFEAFSPREQIDLILAKVQGLVASGVLNKGQGNSLTVKLTGARGKIDDGKLNPAVGKLGAFINEINAFINSGILSEAEGRPLGDAAQAVIDCMVPVSRVRRAAKSATTGEEMNGLRVALEVDSVAAMSAAADYVLARWDVGDPSDYYAADLGS